MSQKPLTYESAGVSIDAGNELVERIKNPAKATNRPGVMGGLGGFGGLFDLKACGYTDPVLVSGTDGVGTKLEIAIAADGHDTIGQDLVAMCVNDVLVQGAQPLFFLDYFACGKLEVDVAARVVSGIARACQACNCALLGGETAEMPGMYAPGHYDLAGFVVAAVERDRMITGETITEGDTVLALASSGVHSNGFSLVRETVRETGLGYDAPAPFEGGQTLGRALLEPTKLYVKSIHALLDGPHGRAVRGMAHITGGGLTDNIPRILPDGLGVRLNGQKWQAAPVFGWLKKETRLPDDAFARTFNCGIGFVVVVAPDEAANVKAALEQAGETVFNIGTVTAVKDGDARVIIDNLGAALA